ncbi:MAG TPA: hypothetical protein VMU50_23445 [Polyangia bacterium]|nr:hypothetical protein [Polyangia bacterium]
MQRRPHQHGHLGRGALLSFFGHALLVAPILTLVFIYASREEAQRAEEVDVAFRDVASEELPADLPPLDSLTQPPPSADDRTPPERKKPKEKAKPEEKTKQKPVAQLPKKEPEIPIPPLPPMPKEAPPPPPPPAPPERKQHEKMVDLDNDKQVEPPKDAKFLAQKNNRAEVETRATDTNLEKAQKGAPSSSNAASKRTNEETGDDKERVADLTEEKSAAGKQAPDVTPHVAPELSREQPPERAPQKSLLALRDPAPRTHELTPETADPSLPRTPDGELAMPRERAVPGPQKPSTALAEGKRMKLALTGKDFDYLFGADAAAERRLAQKERSQKMGRFAKRQAQLQSALENFIPEVKPGNQTALNTRAAPFAAFIARMHRSIHRLWGFGQLEEWDEKPSSNAYNNQDLLTTLEMVLNGDGTIDKITIVRASGYLPYDAAAIDVAYSAGPYPDPPREIRSANGKIYIHWRFYRDGRQCATSGVDYFILNNPPANGDKGAAVNEPDDAPAGGAGAGGGGGGAGGGVATEENGPRRLERGNVHGDGRGHAHERESVAARARAAAGGGAGEARGAAPPRADDPGARRTAEEWFAALARGDVDAMTRAASYPFRSGNGVAASSREQLAPMLSALVDESARRAGDGVQIHSAASLRGLVGRLPPGLDDSTGLLFAVSKTSPSEMLVLVLAPKTDAPGWNVTGLVRR